MRKLLALFMQSIVCVGMVLAFVGCNNPIEDKKFYTLSEAYKNSYIAKEDVYSVYDYALSGGTAEEELFEELKKEYVKEYPRRGLGWKNVEIDGYFGQYENFVAVRIGYADEKEDGIIEENVAGLLFTHPNGREISIFIKGEKPQPTEIPITEGESLPITSLAEFDGLNKDRVQKINIIFGKKAFTIDQGDALDEFMDVVMAMTVKRKAAGKYYAPYFGCVTVCQDNSRYTIDFDVLKSEGKEYLFEANDLQEKIIVLAQEIKTENECTYDKVYSMTDFYPGLQDMTIQNVRIQYRGNEKVLEGEEMKQVFGAVCSMRILEIRSDAKIVVDSQMFANIAIGTEENFIGIDLMEKSSVFRYRGGSFLLCDEELKTVIQSMM